MSLPATPKKFLSIEKCRVCGNGFASTRDKHNLFRTSQDLHTKLEQATGRVISETDGLPHYVCGSCRSTLLTFDRQQKQLERTMTAIASVYTKTVSTWRFKRGGKESPTSIISAKKADLKASPADHRTFGPDEG